MLNPEMTQGDPFYYEIAFVDAAGTAMPLTGWGIQIDFKLAFSDASPLFSLTIDNGGLGYLLEDPSSGIVYLLFDSTAVAGVEISKAARNGVDVPSRTIVGDVKLTPPTGIEVIQGSGSRTVIFLKINAGVTD